MKKKIYLLAVILLSLLIAAFVRAQVPQSMNYQAIARNNAGAPLANSSVAIRVSIHDGSPGGTVVYSERDTATTNAFGLFTCKIGAGNVISGTFSSINWASGDKFMQVELDPTGGSSYTNMGTTQLLSVPYALNAGNTHWQASNNDINNTNSGSVGIGTATPDVDSKLHIAGLVKSAGSYAAYLFGDRSATGNFGWLWYADNHLARLKNEAKNMDFIFVDTLGQVTVGEYIPNSFAKTYSPKLYVLDSTRSSSYNSAILAEISNGTPPTNSGSVLATLKAALVGYATNFDNSYTLGNGMVGVAATAITRCNQAGAGSSRGLYATSDTYNSDSYGGVLTGYVNLSAATAAQDAFGAYGNANNSGAGNAYGIYGTHGNSGTGTKYAGYFNGNLGGTGTYSYTSDANLKRDIQPIGNALPLIMQLKPSAYYFRVGEFGTMNLPQGKHYGLIAQELQTVLPELVSVNSFPGETDVETGKEIQSDIDYLGVNYNELIPLLISGMQQQQKTIEELKKMIEELTAK